MIRVPLAAPPQPLRRGCYAWQPEGCPLQGENSVPVDWKLDALEAIDTQAACFMRKQHFDTFCGTRSTKMVFVPEDRAAETGAPEKASAEERDVDTYVVSGPDDSNTSTVLGPAGQEGSAERAAGGLVGRIVEPAALHEGLPEWWSLIVAGAPQESFSLVSRPPESPGCYFYVPAGCQGQDDDPSPPGWKLDVLGKRLFRKDLDKKDTACALRKVFYDRWCHANDTMMARVPALAAEEESTPAAPDKAVAVELAKPVAFAASRKRRPILNLQAQALEEE
ncbi:unnamed protein product [Prorocentrum cordatum]|uniref:Uncharacterized protein n=1 Tax=Prorocentrum cordatum TaxID=2364126 RepID=A0ABN9SZ96_9DINO|nr:unnamed protein product [Polarella glacialis]